MSETSISPSVTASPGVLGVSGRDQEFSVVLITLFRGPMYRDVDERLWHQLLKHQAAVADHVDVLGLHVVVDEAEGYAFLRQSAGR